MSFVHRFEQVIFEFFDVNFEFFDVNFGQKSLSKFFILESAELQ